ncbi:MAG: dihydrofolate reductase [Candidatus Iainarchaeum archaeon]|uniref:Dihydrofolate reductase n=1 Tax=Candidatus Iainarchaeum sp. TaxID=3101447 RepID=A0A7T9DJ33_9ARCH|nr:MAG: dihydrofolate reductase [Candidatus Diapherotrites archaeon]
MQKKVVLFIAASLDGFIAKEDGNIDWLTRYESKDEDYGFKSMFARIGTVIVGGNTYRQVKDDYQGKPAYVFSRKKIVDAPPNIHVVQGSVEAFFKKLKLDDQKPIWLIGGGELVRQFLEAGLIDEFIITYVPILLGKGIPLFHASHSPISLELIQSKKYPNGLVQLHYVRTKK